jgi:GntR family transcriptional repressor for pyruvate dehydrogenase complex
MRTARVVMDETARSGRSATGRGPRGGAAVTSRSSSDAIAGTLVGRIIAGEYRPGDRLPSERQLAIEFGASRPMVREALRSVVARGLIDVEPGRGAFVRSEDGPRQFEPLDHEYRRRGTTARQLSEARLMLETEAAALATEHGTEDDLAALEAALERLEASPTPLDRVRNDLAFHAALVHAAHNPVIETMFASIQAMTVELMVRSAGDPEVIRQSAPYHRVAFDAVRARDAHGARSAIRAHLSIASRTYGEDYDRSLDTTAAAALRLIGSGTGLAEFLRTVLPEGDAGQVK